MRVLLHNSLRVFPMALLLRKTRRRLDKYCSICLDRESQSVKNDLKSMVAGLLRVQTSTNRVNARKIYRFIGIAINTLLLIPEALSQQGVGFEYNRFLTQPINRYEDLVSHPVSQVTAGSPHLRGSMWKIIPCFLA